ncbi:hypothetical protein OSC52_01115 [Clostridium pasteurianum]|uniref:hypothetical protein n=1 Tax=Clostridium pasteurianum TaxID=1501 RepID=UPI002260E0DB|nr:hypothetical protein [Clostridium pasteurianum]UZW14475.1 hypothetical protein OSC52_01115 [Clostridium pasteurianum]
MLSKKFKLVIISMIILISVVAFSYVSLNYNIPDHNDKKMSDILINSTTNINKQSIRFVYKIDVENKRYVLFDSGMSNQLLLYTLKIGINNKYKLESIITTSEKKSFIEIINNNQYLIAYGKNLNKLPNYRVLLENNAEKFKVDFDVKGSEYFINFKKMELKEKRYTIYSNKFTN